VGQHAIGAAARTDLVEEDQTEPLARAQYRSLRRLAILPDATAVHDVLRALVTS
jgi:hydroxyacylglutathione hydrolase